MRKLTTNEKQRGKMIYDLVGALQWCSGSDDFAIQGKARKGWEEIVLPLRAKAERMISHDHLVKDAVER